MKLELRRLVNPAAPDAEVLVVTDENGVVLPGQQAVDLHQRVGTEPTVTVTFLLGDGMVRLNMADLAGATGGPVPERGSYLVGEAIGT